MSRAATIPAGGGGGPAARGGGGGQRAADRLTRLAYRRGGARASSRLATNVGRVGPRRRSGSVVTSVGLRPMEVTTPASGSIQPHVATVVVVSSPTPLQSPGAINAARWAVFAVFLVNGCYF